MYQSSIFSHGPTRDDDALLCKQLRQCDIQDTHQLSGGQQQRVALGRLLVLALRRSGCMIPQLRPQPCNGLAVQLAHTRLADFHYRTDFAQVQALLVIQAQ